MRRGADAHAAARTQGGGTPEVTREDQANINSFGRLNNRLHEVAAELEGKKARTLPLRTPAQRLLLRSRALTRASDGRRSCWMTWRTRATS
jgi:prefoldin subunit 4